MILVDGTLTGTTALDQSGTGINGNGVLIPHSPELKPHHQMQCHTQNTDFSGVIIPLQEIKSAYSMTPVKIASNFSLYNRLIDKIN